jgi:hypothetical protein
MTFAYGYQNWIINKIRALASRTSQKNFHNTKTYPTSKAETAKRTIGLFSGLVWEVAWELLSLFLLSPYYWLYMSVSLVHSLVYWIASRMDVVSIK